MNINLGKKIPVNCSISNAKMKLSRRMRQVRGRACRKLGAVQGKLISDRFNEAVQKGLSIRAGDIVAGFWPIQDEIDIRYLLETLCEQSITVCLPIVGKRRTSMLFRLWEPGDQLEVGKMGLLQPSKKRQLVEPKILIVPTLAYDHLGRRLGYGGGYYDATLSELRSRRSVIAIGVAFEAQQIPIVPNDASDEPLDWIITEKEAKVFNMGID